MALPFLSAIGLFGRRAVQTATGAAARATESVVKAARTALPTIRGAVARGVSGTVIERTLQRVGINVTQPTLTRVVTAERRRREAGAALQFLGRNRVPNPTRLPLSLTPIARQYAFLVELRGTSAATGEAVSKWITISTDSLMSRQELEDRAAELFEQDPEAYDVVSPEFRLVEGMRASDVEGFERGV